jgi:hypothetical protein
MLASNSEEKNLRDIAKIEAYTPTVGAAILADLVPDDIALVLESP